MNEVTMLMYLLTRKSSASQMGATKKEILENLNLKTKNKSIYFQDLISNLSNYIEPLGLQVRFNPLNSHWFISFDTYTSDTISANPFEGKSRLAASLFYTLVTCLKNSGIGKVQQIKKLRNKKGILDDLRELEKLGYIILQKDTGEVRLTPLIAYQLDINKLLLKLALKLKN
ncbi:MAG: hypothetical protein ACFE8L_14005 [Candidatus Hodarchaeota archaeon]